MDDVPVNNCYYFLAFNIFKNRFLQGKLIASKIPSLPPMGPINVYMKHWSPDGRAYVAIKPIPGKGVLTYLSVTPTPDGSH